MENVSGRLLQFLLLFLVTEVESSGKMTILLVNYRNPDHKVFNGDCCDNLNFCSWNECDNIFKFCAVSLGSTVPCSLGGQLTTGILGDDDFSFPGQGGYLGAGLNNPITISFQEWKGVSVVVEVWDDDGGFIVGKLADFVDKYTLVETKAPDSNKSSSRPRDKRLCGKRSCTNVKVRVYCDDYYLIPQCTEYCVPRDSDMEGHYSCDYERGRKVCHEGWYDALSNCTKKKKDCTPRNDTVNGYYDCDPVSGEKICLTGWMGTHCTQVYVSFSVVPLASVTKTSQNIQTSLHLSSTWEQSFPSATNIHEKPQTLSSNILPISSTNTQNSRTILGFSTGHVRPTSTQIVERKSTYTAKIVLPSTIHFSTSKLQSSSETASEEANKETRNFSLQSSSSYVNENSSLDLERTTSLKSIASTVAGLTQVVSTYVTSSSTPLQHTTRQILIDLSTTAVLSSAAQASSVESTPVIVPTTEWNDMLVLNIIPGKNWTENKRDQLKISITEQINTYCKLQPSSCGVDPHLAINRTLLFNASDVIIIVKNGSRDAVSVTVRVKLPTEIPDLSGGGILPSAVLKNIIIANKNRIQKQIGLEVLVLPSSSSAITTPSNPTIRPTTTNTIDAIDSTPTYSFTPWNLWMYIVGACCVGLVLLAVTLCFKFKINRQNKIQPLDDSPRRKDMLTRIEEKEMVCLSQTRPLVNKKDTLKVKFQDTVLRVRTSSVNSDKSVLYSPFTPDYTNS